MLDKYIDDMYEIYKKRSKRFQYLFKDLLSYYGFLALQLIVLAICIPNAISNINKHNTVKLIIFIICYVSIIASSLFVSILMDRGIKKQYKQLYKDDDMKPDNCLRYITAYYIRGYIENQELDSESKLKMIINILRNKSEQTKYKELRIIGVLLLFLIPFWNSFVGRLVNSIKSRQEVPELFKIMGAFVIIIILVYGFFYFLHYSIADVLNTKSKRYSRIAIIIDEDILLPLIESKENVDMQLLRFMGEINICMKSIQSSIRKNQRKRRYHNIKKPGCICPDKQIKHSISTQ